MYMLLCFIKFPESCTLGHKHSKSAFLDPKYLWLLYLKLCHERRCLNFFDEHQFLLSLFSLIFTLCIFCLFCRCYNIVKEVLKVHVLSLIPVITDLF
jgi:hypothetical protein